MKTIKMIMDVPIDVYTRFVTLSLGTPLNEVLDKIKAEIEQTVDEEQKYDEKWAVGLRYAIKIIDKYREEQEDADSD